MDGLAKSFLKLVGYLFAVLVVSFTAVQSWSLLFEVSHNPVVATLGVVLFEGGMIYWWYAFQKDAEGLGQMAVSMMGAIFGLALVGGATALHLGAIDGSPLGSHTPARLVTLAAIVNLILKFLYPLLSPETFSGIWVKALEGKVSMKAFREADTQVDNIAGAVAQQIGEEIKRRVTVKMLTDYGLYNEPNVIPGEATVLPAPEPETPPIKRNPEEAPTLLAFTLYADGRKVAEYNEYETAVADAQQEFSSTWFQRVWVTDKHGRVVFEQNDFELTPTPTNPHPNGRPTPAAAD